MKKKLISIIGARPQFVKAAVVSKALASSDLIEEHIIHTGQHYDYNVSGLFFDELNIPQPKINLQVGSDSHGKQTAKMLTELETIFNSEKPDIVMVYGDTNSTLAGALAAAKMHIPIAHVEAGMRSFNRRMPEEINRIVTDHVASIHFCSTDTAEANLRNEGISTGIHQVGDVMYDCFQTFRGISNERWQNIGKYDFTNREFILLTIHRAENTDDIDTFQNLWSGLTEISKVIPIIFPAHPRTFKVLGSYKMTIPSGIQLIEPVSYFDMIQLEKRAEIIITDSGGVQKEAYFAKTPCVTIREETEWVELVECGWNRLVGSDRQLLLDTINDIRTSDSPDYPQNLYGDGKTAGRIVKLLEEYIID